MKSPPPLRVVLPILCNIMRVIINKGDYLGHIGEVVGKITTSHGPLICVWIDADIVIQCTEDQIDVIKE